MPNLNKIKGDNYEIYIRDYMLTQEFVNKHNIQGVWLWKDVPQSILYEGGFINDFNEERLKRKSSNDNPLQDTGIDIIRINNNYEFTLIQCKDYSGTIPLESFAGFFMHMFQHKDKCGAIYHTSKVSSKVIEVCYGNDKLHIVKKSMKVSPVTSIITQYKSYDYQEVVINKALQFYYDNFSGFISMPCGTGKTFISYSIACNLANLIIFIVPLKCQAEQIIDRVKDYSNDNYKCLLVDSDGTRDVEQIYKFIKKNNCVFISSTYKSCDVINQLLGKYSDINPFIIVDEFHNMSHRNVYGHSIEYMDKLNDEDLDEEQDEDQDEDQDEEQDEEPEDDLYQIISNKKFRKLFLSATPRFYELEYTNDVEAKYILGDCIYNMDFKTAIENNLITDYRILLPLFNGDSTDDEQVNEIKKEVDIDDYLMSKKCCFLYEGIKHFGSIKCIIYCQDSKEMKNMMDTFNQLNQFFNYNYYINHITCEVSKDKRSKILNDFKTYDGISLLFSVQILDECIDIPECNSIYITYNSKSKIRTIQRMCRAMRKTKDETKVANIFVWCENDFNDCIDIISSIKETDSGFVDKIQFLKPENKIRKRESEIELAKNKMIGIKKFAIGIQEFRIMNWDEKLELVKQYIDQHNKRPSKCDKDPVVKSLAQWISDQIKNYPKKAYIMSNPEIQKKWEAFTTKYAELFMSSEEKWMNKLEQVIKYIDQHNKRPSNCDKDPVVKSLAQWISDQIKNYPKKARIMSNPEIRKKWEAFTTKYSELFMSSEEKWMKNLEQVTQYIDQYNKRPSQSDKDPVVKSLGSWIRNQITNYPKKKEIMSNPEIRKKWEAFTTKYTELFMSDEEIWMNKLEQVTQYIGQHNKRPSQNDKDPVVKSLGTWIHNQIKNYPKKAYIMSNLEIRKKWEQFITKYQTYFPDNEAIIKPKSDAKPSKTKPKNESDNDSLNGTYNEIEL
jgi:superfamily II DNA or RNA helicase/uncharacterized protein YeaO (DUF488 family)